MRLRQTSEAGKGNTTSDRITNLHLNSKGFCNDVASKRLPAEFWVVDDVCPHANRMPGETGVVVIPIQGVCE